MEANMIDRKTPEEISDGQLDEVSGGFGGTMGDEPAMVRGKGKVSRELQDKADPKGVLSSLQTG